MNMLLVHVGSVAALAIAVEAACRLGRFRPAVCHALWLVVLVKLVAPPVVAWPLSAEALNGLGRGSSGGVTGSPVAAGQSVARGGVSEAAPGAEEAAAAPVEPLAAVPLRAWLPALLLGLWIAGGVAVACRIAWQFRRIRRRVASGTALPAWLHAQLEMTCATLGVPMPRAVVTESPGGVYMQIAGAPVLVVSVDALTNVEPARWHTILTHELAHLKRRDHWVAWVILAAAAAWWWNPCFWWVRHRLHLFSEMACDAWVVAAHPGDRKTYAETMVQVMSMLSRQDAPAPAMGLAAWSAATQERRLWMIMKAKGACNVSGIYAAGLVALAVVVAPAWIAVGADDTKPAAAAQAEGDGATGWKLSLAPSEELKTKLETPVNLEFDSIYIKDALEYVQDSFELKVVLDQRVVAPESGAETEAVPKGPFGGEPYVTDGMIPYITLKDIPLKDALVALITPLNLTYQLRGDAIWISSAKRLSLDQTTTLPGADFGEGEILTKLKTRVNIEFEDIHIKDVLEFVQDSFELNLVVDGRVVVPEGGDPNSPPTGSPGFATDGMVRYINLKDAPLGETLYTITRLLNLTYTVKKNYVFISTPELIEKDPGAPAAE